MDTVPRLGKEAREYGERALVVTGVRSSKSSGILDKALHSLHQQNLTTTLIEGVVSNPLLSTVHHAIDIGCKENVDMIVAVGGGSVLDSAKAIAAGIPVNHDVWDFFIKKEKIRSALPVLDVLTLAATGSEMNGSAVITNDITKQKFSFTSRATYPKVSILDPSTTISVTPAYSAYGAVDAVVHILEQYFNNENPNSILQDGLSLSLIRTIHEAIAVILTKSDDYESRATMMWAATLALNGLISSGHGRTSFPIHMIEHALSALYNIPHGAGLAIVTPGWLRYNLSKYTEKLAQLGRVVYSIYGTKEESIAEETVSTIMEWFNSLSIPFSLGGWNIPEEAIPAIAANAAEIAALWDLPEYSEEVIHDILQLCL